MSLATAELPDDPDALRAFAIACQAELKAAELSVLLRTLEIEKLKFQIAKLRRMQFGRSSEKLNRKIEQLELRLEELESGAAEDDAKTETKSEGETAAAGNSTERRKPKRKPLPEHLPRTELVHQPAAGAGCACPDCGGVMSKLGEDVTEVLDYVPGHFKVIRHVRHSPARRATSSLRPRRRRCRPRAAAPRRPCSPTCWCRNTSITFRSTGRARSLPATASISTARHWPTGWDRWPGCSIPWSMQSLSTWPPPRRSTGTIPRCAYWSPVLAEPGSDDCGSTSATIGRTPARLRPPRSTSTAPIAVASIRLLTCPALAAICRLTDTPV